MCPQIYNVGAYPPSPSCDHLNFVKHAFMHGTYRITGDMEVWCEYQVGAGAELREVEARRKCLLQRESYTHWGSYVQAGMKMARRSLMFADKITSVVPSTGVKVISGTQHDYMILRRI